MASFIGIVLLICLGCVVFMVVKESTENNNDLERYEDMRGIKFILRNSPNFNDARRYIENLCDCYNLKECEYREYIDDEIALFTTVDEKQYIIYLDYNSLEVKISTGGNVIRVFNGDSGWSSAIRFLSEKAG